MLHDASQQPVGQGVSRLTLQAATAAGKDGFQSNKRQDVGLLRPDGAA